MSVYSNKQIKQAIKDGHIVCYPLDEKNINGSSVDVTLGTWYYKTEKDRYTKAYNPFSKDDVDTYFDGPKKAEKHSSWCKRTHSKPFEGIPDDHPIIVLKPGERILAHTHEFIGIKAPGTSTMQARSTWGRNGVAVCLDAGWGDPGYINRWTMEIYNMNQHESVVLPVGERIAQLVFYETGEVEGEYASLSGKYQSQTEKNLDRLIADWRPTEMLPKSYKDTRKKPLSLTNGEDTNISSVKELLSKRVESGMHQEPILDILKSNAVFNKDIILKKKSSYNYFTPVEFSSDIAKKYEESMDKIYEKIEKISDKIDTDKLIHLLPFAHRFSVKDKLDYQKPDILNQLGENHGSFEENYKRVIAQAPANLSELIANYYYPFNDLSYKELLDKIRSKGFDWQQKAAKKHGLKQIETYEVNGALAEYLFGGNIKSVAYLNTRNGYNEINSDSKTDPIIQLIFDLSLQLNSWLMDQKEEYNAQYAILLGHRNKFIVVE